MWVCFIHFLVLDILFTKDNFQGWWSMDDNYVGSLEATGFFFSLLLWQQLLLTPSPFIHQFVTIQEFY